jgi:hypothetical protein
MPTWLGFDRRRRWLAALALALAFLAIDSGVRLRTLAGLQDAFSGRPAIDPSSPTGYVGGQRALILPLVGMDGYHWVMQTQMMLDGQGLRIRRVDYDNAPYGREVHWSSMLRWWLASVAWVDHVMTGTLLPIAVEDVAPYANTLLLALALLVLAPIVARRFGATAAAVLVLAMVSAEPYFASFNVGFLDHHGMVTSACMLSVVFLLAAGAGWVRTDATTPKSSASDADRALALWLPTRNQARRWVIASAVAGGAGLWISAATQTPVLIGLSVGTVIATGVLARHRRADDRWRPDPTLWRLWGIAGCATSLFFYLLEYFPSHFGWRLEVNHPLFALAWLGGADLLCRISERISGLPASARRGGWIVPALSAAAVLALPLAILARTERTFWVADPMLWMLHTDYIGEFGRFLPYWMAIDWAERAGNVSAIQFVLIAVAALMWRPTWSAPTKALVLFGFPAGIITLALAFQQTRWWGLTDAVWLAMLPSAVLVLGLQGDVYRRSIRIAVVAGSLALIVLPMPLTRIWSWHSDGWQTPVVWEDHTTLIMRNVAQRIRAKAGATQPVVISGPNTTTFLIYYGGLRGLGTLYWENLPGLKGTAEIVGSGDPERAHALIRERGVTHIVMVSWNFFAAEYALLHRGLHRGSPIPEDAFLWRLFNTNQMPPWIDGYRFKLPDDESMRDQWIAVLEVRP